VTALRHEKVRTALTSISGAFYEAELAECVKGTLVVIFRVKESARTENVREPIAFYRAVSWEDARGWAIESIDACDAVLAEPRMVAA
jgi:hypothetical protein